MKKALCSNHKKIVDSLDTRWEPPFTSPNCKVKDVKLEGINKFEGGGDSGSCKLQHTHTPTHFNNTFCTQLIPSLKTPTPTHIHTHTTSLNWRHQQIFNLRWLSLLQISHLTHFRSHQQISSLETTHVVANHNTQTHQTNIWLGGG
jgi:hypothetical protein